MIGYAPACLCRESTYAFGPSGRRSASTNKDSCRGTTSPLRGMGSFAGQKVVHPLARRASPSLDRIKICCEGKMVPLRVVASPKYACSMRTDFLRNNRFTYEFFAGLFSDKTGACVMSSASVRSAAIRKRLMWWCCDLPLKTRRLLWLNQRSLPKNVMPQRLAGPSRLRPLLP